MRDSFLKTIAAWQLEQDKHRDEVNTLFNKRVHSVLYEGSNIVDLAERVVELEMTIEALQKELSYSKANEVPEYNMRNN